MAGSSRACPRRENLATRFDWLDKQLAGKDYLLGRTARPKMQDALRAEGLLKEKERTT